MSEFNGMDLFGSGPAEFLTGPRGTQSALKVDLGLAEPGLTALGDHTPTVAVSGCLCAADAPSLWAALDDLHAQIGTKGDLSDDAGRTWSGVTMLEVACEGPPRRGRLWTLPYRVLFAEI